MNIINSSMFICTFVPPSPLPFTGGVPYFRNNTCSRNLTRMSAKSPPPLKPVILLTNDDGVSPESALILPLARQLCEDGHDVVVCAPGQNNSACGQRITLSKSNVMRRHLDYEDRYASSGKLYVFSIDEGTPCDCIIASIEPDTGLCAKLSTQPHLVVSGINVGQNLGTDIFYSGTFSAARQSSFYGIPSIGLSVNFFSRHPNSEEYSKVVQNALSAASKFVTKALNHLPSQLPDPGRIHMRDTINQYSVAHDPEANMQERLNDGFSKGDIAFNVNIPTDWDGSFTASTLDSILYRSVINLTQLPSGVKESKDETVEFKFSGKRNDQLCFPGSDLDVLRNSRAASVSPVSTWPVTHPLALPEIFFTEVVKHQNKFWDKPLVEKIPADVK